MCSLKMTIISSINLQNVLETKSNEHFDGKAGVKFSNWCSKNWRPILAEFISTSLLVLLGCMSCLPVNPLKQVPPIYSSIGFGLIVMLNIQVFGHISGAYMNPAITLVAVITGRTHYILGIVYFLAQCSAAIFGYFILTIISPIDLVEDSICVTLPHEGLDWIQAVGIETALTAALSLITCAVWDPVNVNKDESNAIKFGLTITGLSLAGGQLTGCSMNPARSLGPAVITGNWTAQYIYWIGPLLGSGIAAFLYKYTFLSKTETSISENRQDRC